MIASYIKGRVRIRTCALKNHDNMELVQNTIKNYEGIKKLTPNIRTGSLLIEYDPEIISEEMLQLAATALEQELSDKKKPSKKSILNKSATEALLLNITLGATLLTGFRSRRWHIVIAGIFTILTATHCYSRKKKFFSNKG